MITGATGFLGSHIVDELVRKNFDLTALVRKTSDISFLKSLKNVKFVNGDLLDCNSLKKAFRGCEVVIHNASVVDEWGTYKYFYKNNVLGTQNVLDAVLDSSIKRIIYTSSADIYKYSLDEIMENYQRKPRAMYHKSKIAAEDLLDSYAENHGLNIIKIRPPGIIGPRNYYMAESVKRGISKGQVTVIGTGEQVQSYVDPRDVATAIGLILENKNLVGETFNVKSFNASVKEYWKAAAKHLKKEITFTNYPYKIAYAFGAVSEFLAKITRRKTTPRATRFRVDYFGKQHMIDDTKISRTLKYKPKFDLKTSMGQMLDSLEIKEDNQILKKSH